MNGHILSEGKDVEGSGRGLFYIISYGQVSCSSGKGEMRTPVSTALNFRVPPKSRNYMSTA
jgi:hypothetical protein